MMAETPTSKHMKQQGSKVPPTPPGKTTASQEQAQEPSQLAFLCLLHGCLMPGKVNCGKKSYGVVVWHIEQPAASVCRNHVGRRLAKPLDD